MKLMRHQEQSVKFLAKNKRVFDTSDPGCVSADTEYLTSTGWKRIDQYQQGDQVAQFYPHSREIEFVTPLAYIKKPCDTMLAIAPVRGTSQRLSLEHRILFYKTDGLPRVCSAQQYMEELHRLGPNHFKAKFCTTFSLRTNSQLSLSDQQLRLMVAVIADGYFGAQSTNRCVIRLKKERKKARLRELLFACHIFDFDEHECRGQIKGFTVFKFNAPRHEKQFTSYWWGANQHQLEIIADELCYWDSAEDKRKSNGTCFSTFINASADFAQYAFSASKRPSSLTYSVRDRRNEDRGIMVEYNVHARGQDALVGPGRRDSVYTVKNPEGYKYCFEVPTSFLLLRHNGYIFATGNTGKTGVHIVDFSTRRAKRSPPALILAPKSLLNAAWFEDFKKFAPDMKCSIAYATNRDKAFEVDADVYITNHDAATTLAKKPDLFWKKFKGGTLIIDESSAFKHHTSQRSRAMVKIAKHFEYRRLLSGTPNSNGIVNVWHQVYLLDNGKRLGKSFFGFRAAVCTPQQVSPMSNMIKWVDKENAETAVSMLIKDIVIRHKFEDCVDIPKNHQYSIKFQLNKKHMVKYKEMEDDSRLILSKSTVTAINGAVLYGKLLQIASGATYNDDGDYSLLDTERYELVLDLVEARQHSVVFFHWTHQRDELIKEANKRKLKHALIDGTVSGKQRNQVVSDYQKGYYDVLFAHPASAGHGLTLTRGTATIWASPTPNLEHYLQGLKRIHRIGQKAKTETIMVLAPGTIEEQVYNSLMAKNARMDTLLDYLRKVA